MAKSLSWKRKLRRQYKKELLIRGKLHRVMMKGNRKTWQHRIPRESKKEEQCRTWQDDVPMEIFCTIFGSFSIENICELRGVCRSWKSMIDSCDFVTFWNLHHKNERELLLVAIDKKCQFSRAEVDDCVTSLQLVASNHSLLCFVETNNNDLLVCNPITRHVRCISSRNGQSIESVGLYYDPRNDAYKVITVRRVCKGLDYNLITEIYDSVTKRWEYQCKFQSDYKLEKTSPIVWYQGYFTWIIGQGYGLQLVVRFDEVNKTWEPFGKTTRERSYCHLHLNNNRLVLDDSSISCNEQGNLVISNSFIEGNTGHWCVGLAKVEGSICSLHVENVHHQCEVPNLINLFKRDYLVPPKHCKVKQVFAFSPGLATV